MKILLEINNVLPKSRKKKLKNIDLFEDIFLPGGLPVLHVATKVGLAIDGKVKVFKDRKSLKPYITTMKDFLS